MDRRRLVGPDGSVQPLWPSEACRDILAPGSFARKDGRFPEQLRPVVIHKGIITRASGSAYVEIGGTKLICAVHGPRSPSLRIAKQKDGTSEGGMVTCEIDFFPFSRRSRYPYQASEAELSRLLTQSLVPAIRRELFPNAFVDVYVSVLEDDGGILAASIVAASVALVQAQIEVIDSVVACSALVQRDGQVVVDPTMDEESLKADGITTLTVAVLPNLNRITQSWIVGCLSGAALQEALNLVMDGARTIYEGAVLGTLTVD